MGSVSVPHVVVVVVVVAQQWSRDIKQSMVRESWPDAGPL